MVQDFIKIYNKKSSYQFKLIPFRKHYCAFCDNRITNEEIFKLEYRKLFDILIKDKILCDYYSIVVCEYCIDDLNTFNNEDIDIEQSFTLLPCSPELRDKLLTRYMKSHFFTKQALPSIKKRSKWYYISNMDIRDKEFIYLFKLSKNQFEYQIAIILKNIKEFLAANDLNYDDYDEINIYSPILKKFVTISLNEKDIVKSWLIWIIILRGYQQKQIEKLWGMSGRVIKRLLDMGFIYADYFFVNEYTSAKYWNPDRIKANNLPEYAILLGLIIFIFIYLKCNTIGSLYMYI